MKKLLLSLITFVSLASFSQASMQITESGNPVAANGTVVAVTTASGNVKVYFDVKNISASSKSYKVTRYDMLLHTAGASTASAYFCFAGSCWGAGTYSAGTLVLAPGASASSSTVAFNMLVTDLDEANTTGLSIVKYTFTNINLSTDSLQVTVAYNQPAGINENNALLSSFELSPNPVNENAIIKINSAKAIDGKFYIYNALGAIVNEKAVSLTEGKNKIDFNAENLPSGIYFANLKFGGSSTTKKFIVR